MKIGEDRIKLAVRDVSKAFRQQGGARGAKQLVNVLRKICFEVRKGEIVSIIGESGCGKTTLLRVVQGLIKLDSGSIEVDGVPVSGPGRDRGFVFQQASLLPWRTARQNIEFGLELQGVPKSQRRQRSSELIELVGLSHAADQLPYQLSGGMQQRIGLARAMAINPEILLMDEPFSALDAQTREVLQAEMLRIQAETGKTTLFVTHDLDEAIYLSNRVVVLAAEPGRVEKVIDIPFSHPRPRLAELRGDPRFMQIRAEMWEFIRKTSSTAAA